MSATVLFVLVALLVQNVIAMIRQSQLVRARTEKSMNAEALKVRDDEGDSEVELNAEELNVCNRLYGDYTEQELNRVAAGLLGLEEEPDRGGVWELAARVLGHVPEGWQPKELLCVLVSKLLTPEERLLYLHGKPEEAMLHVCGRDADAKRAARLAYLRPREFNWVTSTQGKDGLRTREDAKDVDGVCDLMWNGWETTHEKDDKEQARGRNEPARLRAVWARDSADNIADLADEFSDAASAERLHRYVQRMQQYAAQQYAEFAAQHPIGDELRTNFDRDMELRAAYHRDVAGERAASERSK